MTLRLSFIPGRKYIEVILKLIVLRSRDQKEYRDHLLGISFGKSSLFEILQADLLQVVDMRWGVRDEMTNEHMTTDLCMTELRNCQRLSMGPNFIFFGGQKYGYRPIPTEIITSELAQLREVLVR